jgi:hypothetical protein
MRAGSSPGARAWLTMAQTWLERAQMAERREAASAGDVLPVTAVPGADPTGRNGEPDGGAAR